MSNTLLDTVGSHNKQFSAMTFPAAVPQKPLLQPAPSETINKDEAEHNKNKTKKLLIALGGLAVLGAGSVILYKKLKQGKVNPKPVSGSGSTGTVEVPAEPSMPLEEIKINIKDEYHKAKENIIEKFNAELPDKLKNNAKKTFKSSNELLNFENSLQNGEDFSVEKYEKMRNTASSAIRKRISELNGDKDWHDLRAQRKILVKQIEKAGDDSAVAQQKISLVNDLLVYKADPSKKQTFINRNLMTPEDAIGLIKRDFNSVEEFNAERQKLFKFDFGYDLGEDFKAGHFRLKVKDVFKTLKEKYDFAKEKLAEVKEIKKLMPELIASFKEKLNALAQKFRNSELMQKFRKLVRKPE